MVLSSWDLRMGLLPQHSPACRDRAMIQHPSLQVGTVQREFQGWETKLEAGCRALREQDGLGCCPPGTAQLLVTESAGTCLRGIHRTPCTHSIWGPLQHPHHSLFTASRQQAPGKRVVAPLLIIRP